MPWIEMRWMTSLAMLVTDMAFLFWWSLSMTWSGSCSSEKMLSKEECSLIRRSNVYNDSVA